MENQFGEKNDNNQNLSDSDELKRLEELIKQSESDLESLDAELASIEKQMQQKKNELQEVEAKKTEPRVPKILTRKQLNDLEKQRKKAKEEKLLELKNNIDIITRSEFEKARLLRANYESCLESEKKDLEMQALKIETDALEKEISIKKSIFYDRQEKLRDMLAEKILEELKIKKLRKELSNLQSLRQDKGIRADDIRTRLNAEVSHRNSLVQDYDRISKEVNTINLKLQRSADLLKVKLAELEDLKK